MCRGNRKQLLPIDIGCLYIVERRARSTARRYLPWRKSFAFVTENEKCITDCRTLKKTLTLNFNLNFNLH